MQLGPDADPVKLELLASTYRFGLPRYDQSQTPVGECGIEFVVRKRTPDEIAAGGRWQRLNSQPGREVRLHLNQYRDDMRTLKNENRNAPPFNNDAPL
jgi:hypothetical protein